MARFEVHVVPERCSGCLRCALACSDLHAKRFALSEARIHIYLDRAECRITFDPECTHCGICADQCLYDALIKSPHGEGK